MLLAVNITNKNINFGLFKERKLLKSYSMKSDVRRSSDEIYVLMKILIEEDFPCKNIDGVIIASVVPEITKIVKNTIEKYLKIKPLIVGVGVKTGLNIRCENPKEVGSDRIVNAVSVIENYGGPAIIIDLGYIITFDAINNRNEYLGGMILPGITMARNALSNYSAKLPQVDIVKSKKIVGNTTVKAIQSGIYNSYKNILDGNIKDLVEELEIERSNINIIVTGEDAKFLTSETEYNIKIDEDLDLKGLQILYEINK